MMVKRSSATVHTKRLRLHCRWQGDSDGIPMLLLHGSFGSGLWWQPFLDILPSDIYAVAPDLRGCGQSDKPATGYTIPELALDVLAFIEELQLDDFHLVGHSSGGAIAIEVALRAQSQLRSLVLVDSVPIEGVFTPLEAMALLEQMQDNRELLRQAIEALMPSLPLAERADSEQPSHFVEQLVQEASHMAEPAFTELAVALNHWNRFEDAHRLTLPTLLVRGELDHIVEQESLTRTLIAIPGANNLEVLRGVGHAPMIEAPVTLAERIIDFITEDFEELEEIRSMVEDHMSSDELDGDGGPIQR